MQFKIGDKVKRIGPTYYDAVEGREYMISNINGRLIQILGSNMYYDFLHFELVEENKMQKQFTKNDLKTGMRVVHRNERVGIVLKDGGIIYYPACSTETLSFFTNISSLEDGLSSRLFEAWDIIEVYSGYLDGWIMNIKELGDLLWKREEKSPEQIEAEKIAKEIESLKLRLEELSKKI